MGAKEKANQQKEGENYLARERESMRKRRQDGLFDFLNKRALHNYLPLQKPYVLIAISQIYIYYYLYSRIFLYDYSTINPKISFRKHNIYIIV